MGALPKLATLAGNHHFQVYLATVALGTPLERVVFTNKSGRRMRLQGASYNQRIALTGDNTNNLVMTVKNKGTAGTGTTSMATLTMATGVDFVANVDKALTVSTTTANQYLAADEAVSFHKTETGTGLALTEGVLTLLFTFE